MPWTMASAAKKTKSASTPAKKKQWSTVANKVLAESGDEGKAIRIASATIKKRKTKKAK